MILNIVKKWEMNLFSAELLYILPSIQKLRNMVKTLRTFCPTILLKVKYFTALLICEGLISLIFYFNCS